MTYWNEASSQFIKKFKFILKWYLTQNHEMLMVPRNVILRLFATNFHGVKKNFYGTISLMKRSILIRKRRVIKVGLDGKAWGWSPERSFSCFNVCCFELVRSVSPFLDFCQDSIEDFTENRNSCSFTNMPEILIFMEQYLFKR